MTTQWFVIGIFTIMVENFSYTFFFHRRFNSKYNVTFMPILLWLSASAWGVFVYFLSLNSLYDVGILVIYSAYIFIFKLGSIIQKLLNFLLAIALTLGSSLVGAGVASLLTDVTISHTLQYQDTSRLLALIFIKSLQVILFYVFSSKRFNIKSIKKTSTLLSSLLVVLILSCLFLIFTGINEFDTELNNTLVWLSTGLLLLLISVFILYEMFMREESSNIELSTKLQRLELESAHYKELDTIHADIRKWRHEYNNNIIALKSLVESGDSKKTLEYISTISNIAMQDTITLQTGNLVLDAVVSSKLWYADSLGIDVSIHAIYPKDNHIDDNDMCAIAGNLLDNATEACIRINDDKRKKFISFSLLAKGKNLVISVVNSYEGQIKKKGTRFITDKDERFHGFGIQYLDSIVDKYEGQVLREYADGVFETHILIPLIPKSEVK
ncbi:MAG: GHKL domain-containing protein [Oscillospiraceae bacterium]|nr:GHKL domain-containing protein [Oscillospiraceae bacterium]